MRELLIELVFEPAALAFLEVGTFVAVALAAFELLRWRLGDRLTWWLEHHRHRGPLVGAALGAVPGCGGAIVVMPLYLRGQVSFGTVVATLTATMGDSSFVLLAADPSLAVTVHLGLLVVGALTGWIVDLLGIDPRAGRHGTDPGAGRDGTDAWPATDPEARAAVRAAEVTAAAGPPAHGPARVATVGILGRPVATSPHPSLWAYWALTLTAFVFAVPVVFQVVDPDVLPVAGIGLPLLLGGIGALLGLTITVSRRLAPTTGPIAWTGPRAVLIDAARQTAEVTTWVVTAFVGYELFVAATGVDIGALPTLGLLGVLAGALLGLIPGCGPQLVLTGLYAQGVLPVSVLAANALSQDGDALFPLLAADRRSAVAAMGITTLPGLLIGAALVALGL